MSTGTTINDFKQGRDMIRYTFLRAHSDYRGKTMLDMAGGDAGRGDGGHQARSSLDEEGATDVFPLSTVEF